MKKTIFLFLLLPIIASCSGSSATTDKQNQVTDAPLETQSGEVTINMTEDGFVPDEIKITKGTKVTFKNSDKFYHWPASDLHPSHSQYSDFDPRRTIEPGESWSFVFDKVGEWGMHDHISPYMIGKIHVVE